MPNSFRFVLCALIAFTAPALASPEGSDTVPASDAKLILDYYRQHCTNPADTTCVPPGVDLTKNEVRVLPSELAKRKADIAELETQTLADQNKPQNHNDYALLLRYCKPPTPPKYKVDIALYKLRGDHAWEIAMEVTQKLWGQCSGYEKNATTQAALRIAQKVKLIDIKMVPPSPAVEQNVDYAFDDKSGTLTVKAFAKTPLPNQSTIDNSWKTLLKNN